MIKVVNVIKEGNRIHGYDCVANNGERRVVSKRDIIALIYKGLVVNATVQMYNGNPIVRIKDDSAKKAAIRTNVEYTGQQLINKLLATEKGIPFMIKLQKNFEYKQCLYGGVCSVQGMDAFSIIDGSGLAGYFALSKAFILNNVGVVTAVFDSNDPCKVNELLSYIGA